MVNFLANLNYTYIGSVSQCGMGLLRTHLLFVTKGFSTFKDRPLQPCPLVITSGIADCI